jgi:predicted glutamine amidotransferase
MHNGDIGGFQKIKRELCNRLTDELYNWIGGQTDSEHFFALFLNHFLKEENVASPGSVASAIEASIAELRELLGKHGITEPAYLNLAITNGDWIVATRYVNDSTRTPPTLYHSAGSRFDCEDGVCRMHPADPTEHAVLVVSEKLTDIKEDWHMVSPNHFVIVDGDLGVSVVPIKA